MESTFQTFLQRNRSKSFLEKEDSKGKGCETPEILSILGHELGHWKMNHTVKMLVIQEALIFGVFYTFRLVEFKKINPKRFIQ